MRLGDDSGCHQSGFQWRRGPYYQGSGLSGEWHGQALSINNKSLTIGGNWDYCGQPDAQYPVGYQVVSGYDNPSSPYPAPVITIRGTSNVSLYGLRISLGDPSGGTLGGGIDFYGSGSLFLRTVILQYNVSSYGGGAIRIDCVSSCNSPATLTMADNVYVYDNTAYAGGGVYLGNNSKLIMKNAYTLFHRNHAITHPGGTPGMGGAIYMQINDKHGIWSIGKFRGRWDMNFYLMAADATSNFV